MTRSMRGMFRLVCCALLGGCAVSEVARPTLAAPAGTLAAEQQLAVESAGAIRASAGTERPVQGAPDNWPVPVHDSQHFTFFRAEQLEYRSRDRSPDVARWEAQGWHGGDYERLWVKTEGEKAVVGPGEGELEVQALYSRLIAPFWDFQVGARYDNAWASGPDSDRWFGVIGVQGLSRYQFEVEAALFISEEADLSGRLTASTDIFVTQRLILQSRFETEAAIQKVPEFQVGQGVNYVDFGLRLRYEIWREFAPYFGVNWIRALGGSEQLVRAGGGVPDDLVLVFGLAMWF